MPAGYGDEHYEATEGSGGLSGAVVDVARILAAMNARPYSPLGRPAVESLLERSGRRGRRPRVRRPQRRTRPAPAGQKGGLFQTSQSGIWFDENGLSSVVVWNGLHTGNDTRHDGNSDDFGWFPRFDKVLDAAAGVNWGTTDLFPDYGMDPLPQTQEGWRWCVRCEGMFFAAAGKRVCPAGGIHDGGGSGHYHVMFNSSFPYGQNGWRYCKKCGGLHYGGFGPGVCAAGGGHDGGGSLDYRLVANSPSSYNRSTTKSRPTGATARSARARSSAATRPRAAARRAGRTTGRAASTTAWRSQSGRRRVRGGGLPDWTRVPALGLFGAVERDGTCQRRSRRPKPTLRPRA